MPSEVNARRFVLRRDIDVSGVSGVGVVAEGVQFTNGKCCMQWLTTVNSIAIYQSIDDLVTIHGHDGKTTVWWLDDNPD